MSRSQSITSCSVSGIKFSWKSLEELRMLRSIIGRNSPEELRMLRTTIGSKNSENKILVICLNLGTVSQRSFALEQSHIATPGQKR